MSNLYKKAATKFMKVINSTGGIKSPVANQMMKHNKSLGDAGLTSNSIVGTRKVVTGKAMAPAQATTGRKATRNMSAQEGFTARKNESTRAQAALKLRLKQKKMSNGNTSGLNSVSTAPKPKALPIPRAAPKPTPVVKKPMGMATKIGLGGLGVAGVGGAGYGLSSLNNTDNNIGNNAEYTYG